MESKKPKEHYVLRVKEFLPEGFRLDEVFEKILQYLYVSQLISFQSDEVLILTNKGKEYVDNLLEKATQGSFKDEILVLNFVKTIKVKKGLVI